MAIEFPASPSVDDYYYYGDRAWIFNGTYWKSVSTTVGYSGSAGYTGSTGESSFLLGPSPPELPVIGDRWFDTESGCLLVWTDDTDSQQWVEVAASGYRGPNGYTGSRGTVDGLPTFAAMELQGNVYAADGSLAFNANSKTIEVESITTQVIGSASTSISIESGVEISGLTEIGTISDRIDTLTFASGNVTHDCTSTSIFYHSDVLENFTANFINVPSVDDRSIVMSLVISQGFVGYIPSGVQIENIPQTILWAEGIEPSGTANKLDVVSFTLLRIGGSWTVLGSMGSFG